MEKIFKANVEELNSVLAFLEEYAEGFDISMKVMTQVNICIEEMFVNICHYAYGESEGEAIVDASVEDGRFSITLKDSGMPYDPLKKEDPDITLTAQERQIGGLGIFMVKKMMDEVFYERRDNQNIFTMVKLL